MLCPCCGDKIKLAARECNCGARFVGNPLDDAPIKVQRLGPAMIAVLSFAAVVGATLVITKFFAIAAIAVIWASWRATRLARRDPESYGGYRTAAAMLVVTIIGGVIASAYAAAYVPRLLENRRLRQVAATSAAFHHMAGLLEEYKQAYGSYPRNTQELKKAINESLPSDYWRKSINYQSYTDSIADSKAGGVGINFRNFELRSAGPDEKMGTDDDVIMRDGIVLSGAEINKLSGRESATR